MMTASIHLLYYIILYCITRNNYTLYWFMDVMKKNTTSSFLVHFIFKQYMFIMGSSKMPLLLYISYNFDTYHKVCSKYYKSVPKVAALWGGLRL